MVVSDLVFLFQILNLLMTSLVSKAPLIETLLKHKQEPKLSSSIPNQAIPIESQILFGDTKWYELGKVSVKLAISKSKMTLCYAEAGEDFVDLLFSFLTLPLAFIVKNMKEGSLNGCIGRLYKSIHDFDVRYMNSIYHKEMLLYPKLVPGFCLDDSILGTEISFSYVDDKLINNRSLLRSNCSSPESYKLTVVNPKPYFNQNRSSDHGFLKGPAVFLVTDNLVVRPKSRIFLLHVLKSSNVPLTVSNCACWYEGGELSYRSFY